MKRKLPMIILVLLLAALICVSLVACDPSGSKDSDNGPRDFETAKYTVTFKTNGDTTLSNPKIENVPYGSKIEAPKDKDGKVIEPAKKGYKWLGWTQDGTNLIDFNTFVVTSNVTLQGKYERLTFTHTPMLNYEFVSTPIGDGKYSYSVKERTQGTVTLPADELDEKTTKLQSTYDDTNLLPCPKLENKVFCFWYYMENGKPVQFSRWADKDAADVNMLSKYAFTKPLELYPMFDDNLPEVTVEYLDTIKGTKFGEQKYVFGQNVPQSAAIDPSQEYKGDYTFDYWYYVVKEVDKNDEEITTNIKFDFETENSKTATSPMTAANAQDNFTPVTLSLYAKWTRRIEIASVDDYMSKLYNVLHTTKKDGDGEENAKEIEELLNANIFITADLQFPTDNQLAPLFDSEHVFKGKIDGGVVKGNETVCSRIIGGLFGDTKSASVFGYNGGVIQNLIIENVGLQVVPQLAGGYEDSLEIGAITTRNLGTIMGCMVNLYDFSIGNGNNKPHTVVFGGVTAYNRITTDTTGLLSQCTVTITGFAADCEALIFGGISGDANASSRVTGCIATIEVFGVECVDDNISSNGRSTLVMGGLVGNNSSAISQCQVRSFTVKNAESLTDFVFGGVAGSNTGTIRKTSAIVKLGAEDNPVLARGSRLQQVSIGGLVGKNEGDAGNCFSNAELYVSVTKAPSDGSIVSVGGLIGNNYSDKTQTNTSSESGICAIFYCYSIGKVVVNVAEDIDNVNVYAGGIAGRNTHSKLKSMFSTVSVEVNNVEANSNLGYLFGAMEKKSTVNGNCYYVDNPANIKLNGASYERVYGEDDKFTENFHITVVGDATEEANFKKAGWVVGSETDKSQLGFSGNDWGVEDGSYPYLKN